MHLQQMDSRCAFGTDCKKRNLYQRKETSQIKTTFFHVLQPVRVVLGRMGESVVRMSAPDLNIFAEGRDEKSAWISFLGKIKVLQNSEFMIFDVGPTHHEEIREGLNAPEDENLPDLCDEY